MIGKSLPVDLAGRLVKAGGLIAAVCALLLL